MTGIDELRRTLDDRANDATGLDVVSRTAAVHERVGVVRRRRRAAVAAGAVAALAVAGGVALLPDDGGPTPASTRTIFGVVAPASMTSLGHTYVFDRVVEGDGSRVRMHVDDASGPLLVSWATEADDDQVRVAAPTDLAVSYDAPDFTDFVVVDPDVSGELIVTAHEGEVGLAVYALTDEVPPGLTEGGVTFRGTVADRSLIDAAFAHPGDADVTLELESSSRRIVAAAVSCSGAPEGSYVNVELDGAVYSRPCGGQDFDPGSRPLGTATIDEPVTVRAWVSSRSEPDRPIDDPDVRVAVALYSVPGDVDQVGAQRVPDVLEHQGHLYVKRVLARSDAGSSRLEQQVVPDGPTLVMAFADTSTADTVDVGFGRGLYTAFAGGSGGQTTLGLITEPATAVLQVQGTASPTTELGVATYVRVD